MTESEKQLVSRETEFADGGPYLPRLGDLAIDLGKGGRVGVVVALPSCITASYHLRPPGGGREWTAKRDGSTLRPLTAPAFLREPGHDR